MNDEGCEDIDVVFHDVRDSFERDRTSFSCSPRDFRLPTSLSTEDPAFSRRSTSRRSVAPRDKNKVRVAEILRGEKNPTNFETASEARLQRHILDSQDRRRREWPSDPHHPTSERPMHEVRIANMLRSSSGLGRDVSMTPRCPGSVVDDEFDDWIPSTPLAIEALYSSSEEDDQSVDDVRSSPMDASDMYNYGSASMQSLSTMPVAVPGCEHACCDSAKKRKHDSVGCDESSSWARRRRPMLLPARKSGTRTPTTLSTSPLSTSPRRLSLLHNQNAFVSPSSSPLAARDRVRSIGTPNNSAGTPPSNEAHQGPYSRPMSPSTSWRLHTRSPSHSVIGSGPGYGSGAIGLRLGAQTPWDGLSLSSWLGGQAENYEMDEGVKSLGLS
ncbi:hypothetical protein MYAM1_000509 [Malassezia yamatoensis]|uniref:Uncharacterized protein n=1 Tax=Malassezia yamatoensis TaxID=253288 RepID=A0AAJ5YNW7_9BASI|nr:hypothetical protein MYAM1_000509 [Malassezia yamatoensis]